ncbi:MAG: 3'(2'),5'-bisphosphate nucleotidase [Anaerolineae bacterium]|nr:3'(2'),5'-bisphosphate nucleotidase [Anaerolineae bacterium]
MAASLCQSIQAELVDPAQKDGREPVTVADYASQALIGHALAENFPDDAVIAEERSEEFMLLLSDHQRSLVQRFVTDALGGYVFEDDVCAWLDFGKQKQARRTWVIDPIDGTKGFLGQRHYCVAIGLLVDGEPALGVLASPAFYSDHADPPADPGILTYASRGGGAYMQPLYGGEAIPIHVSATRDPRQALLLTSFEKAHIDEGFIVRVMDALGREPDAPRRRVDSQDKHAMIAAGLGDMMLRLPPGPNYLEKPWDQAAGHAIVTEAGGRVTDLEGRPLDFKAGARLVNNRGVLITNGHLHEAVLEAIAESTS